jgi:hypothetical protein
MRFYPYSNNPDEYCFRTMDQSIISFIVMLDLVIIGTASYIFFQNILLWMEAERKHLEETMSESLMKIPNERAEVEMITQSIQVET